MRDFAIFIISHNRADTITTVDAIQKHNYTGKWYIVLDDLDKSVADYRERFGEDKILVFDKMKFVAQTDTGMSEPLINFAVFARNAVEQFAKDLGYRFFGVFDDDILRFRHRYVDNGKLLSVSVVDLDAIVSVYLDLVSLDNIACVSFGTAVSYAGGKESYERFSAASRRMCFQAMLRDITKPVDWRLNMYEDLITPLDNRTTNLVWLQLLEVEFDVVSGIGQGKVKGGNSDVYNTYNAFKQVMFPVLTAPDCNYVIVKNSRFRTKTKSSEYVFPKIISERYKK